MIKRILYTMINCRITNFIDIKINVVFFSIRHLHQLSSKISKKKMKSSSIGLFFCRFRNDLGKGKKKIVHRSIIMLEI